MFLTNELLKKVSPSVCIVNGDINQEIFFSIDSRSVKDTDFFFALVGNNVDGHDFVEEALQICSGVVVSFSKKNILEKLCINYPTKFFVFVNDVFDCLIGLSTLWRTSFNYPIVGITGSVGKTTTKEFLSYLLQKSKKKYFIGTGNINTLVGVAVLISFLNDTYDGAIFELGISQKGEMEKLVTLLRPTIGVITSIGHSHTEGLGNLEGVSHEKRKIFSFFSYDNVGIICGDIPLLADVSYLHPIIKFGLKKHNNIYIKNIKQNDNFLTFVLKMYDKKYFLKTFLPYHKGIFINLGAAIAVAYYLGCTDNHIIEGIMTLPQRKNRFELLSAKNQKTVIVSDCYNASPESMKEGLLAFEKMEKKGKKIVVIGDMLELGERTLFWHRQIGRVLKKIKTVDEIVLVGSYVHVIKKLLQIYYVVNHFESAQEAALFVAASVDKHKESIVFVKASNGVKLHHVVDALL